MVPLLLLAISSHACATLKPRPRDKAISLTFPPLHP